MENPFESWTYKRMARFFLAMFIVLFCAAYIGDKPIIEGVRASDIGSVIIEDYIIKNYQPAMAVGVVNMNWTVLQWDTANYNYISWIKVNDTNGFYSLSMPAASSFFTCVNGCIGGGAAYYDQVGTLGSENIIWVFSTGTTFQYSPIEITYSDANFTGSISSGVMANGAAPPHPECVNSNFPVCFTGSGGLVMTRESYSTGMSVRTTNTYNATWFTDILGLGAMLNVYKDGVIGTQVNVSDSNGVYQTGETTTSDTVYSGVIRSDTGMTLNISMINGGYSIVMVNDTGWTGAPFTPAPEGFIPNPNGWGIVNYSHASVEFGYSNYFNNSDFRIVYDLKYLSDDSDYLTTVDPALTHYIVVTDPTNVGIYTKNIVRTCTNTRPWWDVLNLFSSYACSNDATQGYGFYIDAPTGNWTNGTYTASLYEKYFDNVTLLAYNVTNVYELEGFQGEGTDNALTSYTTATNSVTDLGSGIKSLLDGWFGDSPATHFIEAMIIVITIAFLVLKYTKVPMFAAGSTILSTGMCIMLGLLPMIWGIMFVVLTAVTFARMMRSEL